MSLQGSTTCPSFAQSSVYQGSNATLFKTVAEFDKYIESKLLSDPTGLAQFKRDNNCNGLTAANLPPVRYVETLWCATMVDLSQKAFGCVQSGGEVNQMCKTSATASITSLDAVLANATLCTPAANATSSNSRNALSDFRLFLTNGASSNASCLIAVDGEKYCGFATQQLSIDFCKSNPSDTCCKSTVTVSPSPAATAGPAAQQSSSSIFTPVVIGAGCAILFVILLLALTLFIIAKRRASPELEDGPKIMSKSSKLSDFSNDGLPAAAPTSPMSEVMYVIFEYTANLFDEVTLNVGDQIAVKAKFDDGWAAGTNINTKQEGSFPLACVGTLSQYQELQQRRSQFSDGFQTDPRDSWMHTNRTMSMISRE